jgi:hypothetical protein
MIYFHSQVTQLHVGLYGAYLYVWIAIVFLSSTCCPKTNILSQFCFGLNYSLTQSKLDASHLLLRFCDGHQVGSCCRRQTEIKWDFMQYERQHAIDSPQKYEAWLTRDHIRVLSMNCISITGTNFQMVLWGCRIKKLATYGKISMLVARIMGWSEDNDRLALFARHKKVIFIKLRRLRGRLVNIGAQSALRSTKLSWNSGKWKVCSARPAIMDLMLMYLRRLLDRTQIKSFNLSCWDIHIKIVSSFR